MGSRHSFNPIADSPNLISCSKMKVIHIDEPNHCGLVESQMTLDLCWIHASRFAAFGGGRCLRCDGSSWCHLR